MLEGRFDTDGVLAIKRGKKFKRQYCVHSPNGIILCGDSCPHIGEPYRPEKYFSTYQRNLDICWNKTICFDVFEDQRKG